MISLIKKISVKIFPSFSIKAKAFKRLILNKESYLYSTGYMESLKRDMVCNEKGDGVPWINFAALGVITPRLKKDFVVFEFGSGNSTNYFADRVNQIVSLEYDKQWFDFVKERLHKNVELIFKEYDIDGDYCRAIKDTGKKYDLVIVDGRDRVNCVKKGLDCLTDRGVLILDDSQRNRYASAIQHAKSFGFKSLYIEGLKSGGVKPDGTTIFYRNGNCLDL